MIKHITFLSKHVKRSMSSCPLPLDAEIQQFSSRQPQLTHKDRCFSLADQLISRGLFSSAQKVIQRLISECPSVPESISAVDFSISRGMKLDSVSYGCLIRRLVISGEAKMAKSVYMDFVIGCGLKPDRKILNSMVICYCKLWELDKALSCFDMLIESNLIPWVGACNAIIKSFSSADRFMEGYECFFKVSEASDIVLDYACYNRLVDGLCHKGYLDEGRHVFNVMINRGVRPTLHLCKSLLIGFCKWGRVEEAEILVTEIESYGLMNNNMYTHLINAYCKGRKMEMAMRLFIRMLKLGYEPDNYTYNTLIHGFANLGLFSKGWIMHDKMVDANLKPDLVTYQILLNNYFKHRNFDCAMRLLDEMLDCDMAPNVHCYTSLITALCKEKMWKEVNSVYQKMLENGVVPDHVLFFTLVKNLPEVDELYLALTVLKNIDVSCTTCKIPESKEDAMAEIEYLLDQIVIKNSCLAEAAFSIYIIALCVGGELDAAINCTEKMVNLGFLPLLTAFNSLIKLFFEKGQVERAGSLLDVMQDHGLVPNETTFSIIVNVFCKKGDPFSAIGILDRLEKRGMKPNVALYSSIINSLANQKMIHKVESIFYRMLEFGVVPDQKIFVAMINVYSKNGWANKAHKLFDKLEEFGLRPNSHAYTALIPGFVKINMTEKSCVYLDRMMVDGFVPNIVLYTSLVKQFLRKRKFEYAMRLVDLMQKSNMEQDLITYITLVSGISRNSGPFNGRRHLSSGKTDKSMEVLFDLLGQTLMLPKGKNLKIPLSSQEQMKFHALKLILEIKESLPIPNLHLHNSIICGFCWAMKMKEAYDHLLTMESEGVPPNVVTFTILINGHIRLRQVDLAIGLFNKMNAHGFSPDLILFNTIVRGLCSVGMVNDALLLSHAMQKRGFVPSKECYENLLISLCACRLSVCAFRIFEDMIAHDYFPCRYNLHWLAYLLSKDRLLNEVGTVMCALNVKQLRCKFQTLCRSSKPYSVQLKP